MYELDSIQTGRYSPNFHCASCTTVIVGVGEGYPEGLPCGHSLAPSAYSTAAFAYNVYVNLNTEI
jgi:hypothetical protein